MSRKNKRGYILIERTDQITDLPKQFNENMERLTKDMDRLEEEVEKIRKSLAETMKVMT